MFAKKKQGSDIAFVGYLLVEIDLIVKFQYTEDQDLQIYWWLHVRLSEGRIERLASEGVTCAKHYWFPAIIGVLDLVIFHQCLGITVS